MEFWCVKNNKVLLHYTQTTDWDAGDHTAVQPDSQNTNMEPSNYVKNLVKETVKLHRILQKYLDPDTIKVSKNLGFEFILQILFEKIFAVYTRQLEAQLVKVELFTSFGRIGISVFFLFEMAHA